MKNYFKVPKTLRLNETHYFTMKIPNKREFQYVASNDFSHNELKDFMKVYKDIKEIGERYDFIIK